MSETADLLQSSPPANADLAKKAREDMLELRNAIRTKPNSSVSVFSDCCGSAVLNSSGLKETGFKDSHAFSPLDLEGWRKWCRDKWSKTNHPSYTGEEWEQYVETLVKKFSAGNQTGAFLGVGLSKDKLIASCFTPDNPLYGKVEGLEFNDADDGLVSLIWTNA